jgi:hypothetical protein
MYPEHAKLRVAQQKSQAIHEFIMDFLPSKGIFLAKYLNPKSSRIVLANNNTTTLVAEFLDIDLNLVEKEKEHMLEQVRKANKSCEQKQSSTV